MFYQNGTFQTWGALFFYMFHISAYLVQLFFFNYITFCYYCDDLHVCILLLYSWGALPLCSLVSWLKTGKGTRNTSAHAAWPYASSPHSFLYWAKTISTDESIQYKQRIACLHIIHRKLFNINTTACGVLRNNIICQTLS